MDGQADATRGSLPSWQLGLRRLQGGIWSGEAPGKGTRQSGNAPGAGQQEDVWE